MTEGQSFALWQLREVAAADIGCIDIERVTGPTDESSWVWLTVSIRMGAIPWAEGGLLLRERETFYIGIPPEFPLQTPSVWVGHKRFAGRPHVQWMRHLCLFQAATEWNPSDGMFGLLDRLEYWLRKGALNQLDPEGEPLHPPAVYTDLSIGKSVIPKANTPVFDGSFWLGLAGISDRPKHVEITGWFDLESLTSDGAVAIALLFSSPLPWEYPKQVAALFRECERQGVAKEFLFKILKAASSLTPEGQPLYMILGAPMRGIAGGPRKQHLSVWAIEAEAAESIRLTIGEMGDTEDLAKLREKFEVSLIEALAEMSISWCPVIEARSEVTVRRDEESPLSYFLGKSISVWGCGALGAPIAIHLCRAGARRLILRDKAIVTPGILIRQPYFEDDVCNEKVEALKSQLLKIRPDIEIDAIQSNVETLLSTAVQGWSDGADLVIDATASDLVRRRLEIRWPDWEEDRIPIASLMLDRTAMRLITAVLGPQFSGGTWDVLRKAKIEILRDASMNGFADGFFPGEIKERPFQPEPGCSEPTFVGSSADSAALAAIGLNVIATQLKHLGPEAAMSTLLSQPVITDTFSVSPRIVELTVDFVLLLGDHQVRISQSAMKEIRAWVSKNRRARKANVETGGLLWGEWDDATRVVWVSEASGPPPDSEHSAEHFVCGVVGTKEENEARVRLTRRSVGYIGMWHTHPTSRPLPSETDFAGMHRILTAGDLPPRKNLLLIVGREAGRDTIGAFLFRRLRGDASYAVHNLLEGRKTLPENII
jgi:integrative and conjugative element protein (TIGR02256 family)